ncbi:arginine--tRNA ligase [Thermaerobacillus caldiproteolyticus]|uniref:arginine--tRNA ligase n=1 Tax=Thermaerobacillus caldiproteolyticus TaxID=247480 RepID=UPI00188BDFF7|nr:arginine--tRNA ligase [Anoxybacillus caldiproteolyticus]QPA31168.1 arginine--tRNA ligase [Anoxybacillus caldiproteolyticus]
MNYKVYFAKRIADSLDEQLTEQQAYELIETPKYASHGDLAFPCFTLAKAFRKSPALIAEELAVKMNDPLFEKVEAKGAYVNVFLDKAAVSKQVVEAILQQGSHYGDLSFGKEQTIVLDFSSPNIAKPFSMGHLRSTVIGSAIANIAEKCGYKAVRINHLGDWGTQFGKLIAAYKRWGDESKIKENPIKELFSLYVKFHEEAETDKQLESEGRAWFKKLEDGNEEAHRIWKWFRDESLKDFSRIYELLGVSFDSYNGEAFYNDKMEHIVHLLEEQNLLSESDGAMVVRLDEKELPPCLIKKSDGATLYATRDLAAAVYRYETYQFAKALYVVGREQSLHFQQVFSVLEKLGFDWAKTMVHVPFGLMLKDGKKMSTRKGRVILLEDALKEAIALAKQNIAAKNPGLENKEEVARQVGVGAVIFYDLKHERTSNIEFSLEDMLKFEGETGPYVQYTYARSCSILRNAQTAVTNTIHGLTTEESWKIVKLLASFPSVIEKAYEHLDPSLIAKYVIDLAQAFNSYYAHTKILVKDEELNSRLALVQAAAIVLKEGLRLLGIETPEQM